VIPRERRRRDAREDGFIGREDAATLTTTVEDEAQSGGHAVF
jgi:hypothetical protein